MANLKFELISDDQGNSNLTVYHGGKTYQAHNSHPAWDQLVAKALAGDPSVCYMFDIGMAVGKRLELSDRVAYAKGYLFLDGDRIDDSLADHIVRMVQAGEEDVQPFVRLLENILQNPSDNSRRQLYRYIDKHKITITRDGQLVLYKYVYRNSKSVGDPSKVAVYRSGSMGPALVNGAPHKEGHVPQDIGDVVSMPRSEVQDNPAVACASGLHVGAWSYVGTDGDVRLEVHVHPRDVVSVPSDANERKIRVCRYKIIGELTKPYDEPVLPEPEPVVVEPFGEEGDVAIEPVLVDLSPAGGRRWLGPRGPQEPPYRAGAGKHPTQKEFDRAKVAAKLQHKGFKAYAEGRKKWVLIGDDVNSRKSWAVK